VGGQTIYRNYLHIVGPRWTSETILDYGHRVFHLTAKGAGYKSSLNGCHIVGTFDG
jgi:hypothetical protein